MRRSVVVRAPARTMGKRAGAAGKPDYSSEGPQPCWVSSWACGGASAFSEATLMNAVPATSLGMVLGVVGYSLGSRRLGGVAAVLSVVALIFGMAVRQGLVPGVEPRAE